MTVILLAAAPVGTSVSLIGEVNATVAIGPDQNGHPVLAQPTPSPTASPGQTSDGRPRAERTAPQPIDRPGLPNTEDTAHRRTPQEQGTQEDRRVPPRPGTEQNGLSVNESAALWSRDGDDFTTNEKYRQLYEASRPPLQALANGTDITFAQPPETAATWSRNDYADLEAGGEDTSIYPAEADLTDGRFIRDAHATVFTVQPSTRGHLAPGETPLYIAPNGTLRGFVDYRVLGPNGTTAGNSSIRWRLLTHEIESVRLEQDGEVIAQTDGTHMPVLDYQARSDGSATFTLEADIRVELRKVRPPAVPQCPTTNTTATCGGAGVADPAPNETAESGDTYTAHPATNTTADSVPGSDGDLGRDVIRVNETVTVTDSVPVEVYNLTAYPHHATYPAGDAGVAIFQNRPWQGYTLGPNESDRVRGVWRFYTARDTGWDTLTRANATGSTTRPSDALPVYVHAYPSTIGPRAAVAAGPQIIETWGSETAAAARTVGSDVHVDVVEQAYTRSYGVAVRHDGVDRDALTVYGIVRNTTATLVAPRDGSTRRLRASTLTVTVINQTLSEATLRIELREAATGDPITLRSSTRWGPIMSDAQQRGYIEIADRRVRTNRSGVAIVHVTEPGAYTARYHPASWLHTDPAYTGDMASVRWHPLTTLAGWWGLLVTSLWLMVPFGVAWYVGRRLTLMLPPDTHYSQR